MKIPNHTCLKEWASVVDALARGQQTILIRKGGIADPAFGVEAERFYLYPTYFHQPPEREPERLAITHWCEVVRTWRVCDMGALRLLESLVVIPRDALETRYRFRPDQALHVIGVRVHALAEAATVDVRPEYGGCRSWVSIDDEISIDRSRPVLPEHELQRRLEAVDALLTPVAVTS